MILRFTRRTFLALFLAGLGLAALLHLSLPPLAAGAAPARPAEASDWPQVQKDARHSGYTSQTVGPPFTLIWQRDLFPISARVQPIIAGGLVFLPSNNGSLHALQASSGQPAWSFATGGPLVNSAAYDGERVFFGSTDHNVYALQASTGALAWKYQTDGTVRAAPLAAGGRVFIGSSDGFMYALDQSTGSLAWRTSIGAPIYDTAAFDNGQVFFGAMNSVAYALDAASGVVNWSRPLPGQGFRDRWTVAGNGKAFFAPMLYGSHHDPLGNGTSLFHADADPPLYNQPWAIQRQAILDYLSDYPYHQPLFVLDQASGAPAFTPPVLYASGGSLSPHSQPVLLPNGNANLIYRRSFGEPAQWGATTNDALYTGELNLSTGDITPVDTCSPGTGGWAGCGTYKSPVISDESAALMRSGEIIYLDIARGIAGLDTAGRQLVEFVSFDRSSGWPFYEPPILFYGSQNGWVVDYNDLKSEIDSDGNDLKRPTPLVNDTFYILHYNRLAAVRGTLRTGSSSASQAPGAGAAGQFTPAEAGAVPAAAATPGAANPGVQDVQAELERQVQSLVELGHLAPTLYFIGLGGEGLAYYTTPPETIYTLSAAYPYLSSSLQGQVKKYLATEIKAYPPHQQGAYPPVAGKVADLVGARREYFAPNPQQAFNFWPGAEPHPVALYAVWTYANNTGDWSYASTNYAALKAIYTTLRNTGTISSYPELAGVTGFARLAQHLGHTADYNDAASFAAAGYAQGADFNQFLAAAQSRYPNAAHAYSTPIFFASRTGYNPAIAVHFDRELGAFLAANAAPAVISYTEQISKAVPLWWLTAPAFSHGENAYAPPEIAWTNFMLHAYVRRTPSGTLKSYLDIPDRKGDLLYIQKLVAVLDAAGPVLYLPAVMTGPPLSR